MAQTRPEGLSPAYSSYVSPDIPDSHYFRWTFRGENSSDYQTKFTIKIYNSKTKTLLHTYTKSSSSSEIPFEEIGYDLPFSNDVRYYWNVTTYGKSGKANETSINAWFYYISYPAKPSITWNYIPKPGDVVVSDTYFEEIKQNVAAVVSDYTNATEDMFTDIENLFTEEVVPSRKDFDTLQKVITLLSETLEDSQTKDIEAPVEDSLGVSDLEVIRNHIDMLLTVRPKPMDAISLQIDDPEMYDIYNVDVKNDGKTDPTMDITWKVEGIPNYNGYFVFDKISPSRDVSYYECFYDYGPSDNMFTCQLYYIADAIENGDSNFFDVNWEGLYTPSTIGKARQSFRVFTVDQRGNRSVQKSVVKSFGSNFKAPLGVKYYEVQYQKGKLNSSGPDPKGSWKTVGKPTATKFTHKVSGAEGKVYYRVRAVDLSGLTTSWHYDNGVTFDPLLPPAPPKNFRCTAQTTTTLTFKWDASARAESYEFRAETNQKNLYAGKNRSATGKDSSQQLSTITL
ncbi:hypothetical protein QO179_24620 [Bacillus stercoris]|nr:hypothetical protein [Bacillus stercoris]